MDITVIVCTHNPREDYLRRTLAALKGQTLPFSEWELLLIDNASRQPLSETWDLSWHPEARHVREDSLGLTAARLRGITESRAGLLVFVDDDNVLDPDYLAQAVTVAKKFPQLGVFGGSIRPEFEEPPPDWTRPYWLMLAIREVARESWSNLYLHETAPCGAGMCVRREVAARYGVQVGGDPVRRGLDRRGASMSSGGDSDLAFTACDLGMGTGLFPSLKLVHLMPKQRFEADYLLRLVEAMEHSKVVLDSMRHPVPVPVRVSPLRLAVRYVRAFALPRHERRMRAAATRGRQRALKELSCEA